MAAFARKACARGRAGRALAGYVFLTLFAIQGSAQPSSLPRDDFWVPDGPVNAVVETNGVVYIGGLFDYVSPVSETGGAFDVASGAGLPGFPKFNGAIKVIQRDNAGGWFVGGLFTAVGGMPVTNLAHIFPDKTLDTNWTPNPDGAVLALAVGETMLYVGGTFLNIGGEAHSLLAAVDAVTGAPLPWRADCTTTFPKPSVNALALSGNRLFVGGYFSFINGVTREHIGSVDAMTGNVTPWFPNGYTGAQAGSRVDAIAVSDDTVFIGGTFTSVGGNQSSGPIRFYLAALSATHDLGASVLPWNPEANGPVTSIALSCDTVYVGGSFTAVGGITRNRLAALDMTTGKPTTWNPDANGEVLGLLLAGNVVYAGGKFTRIGGQAREFLAALDAAAGNATLWSPKADFGVGAMAVSGGAVVAGGVLGPGGKLRKNVAALDARTGKPLDWNPQVTGATVISAFPYEGVYAMAASSETIYLGGPFTQIAGQSRNRLGAVDPVTGAVLQWNPNANGVVEALALSGTKVFVGGRFSIVGGAARTNIASVDATSGAALAWAPHANDKIKALLVHGGALYAGGSFSQIGGQSRNRLARLDPTTGAVAAGWNPNVNDQVSALAILGNALYVGGHFSLVNSMTRNRVAAVDPANGSVGCWNPSVLFGTRSPAVNALVGAGNRLFLGGAFSSVAGQPRAYLAGVTTNCPAAATEFDPNMDNPANAMAVSRETLFAGGVFQNVGGRYRPNLAVFAPAGAPRIVLQPRGQQVDAGSEVLFQGQAVGQAPLSYQWQFNGTNIAGATGPSLKLQNVQAGNSGEYTLTVTNLLGLVQSRPAALTVVEPIVIVSQPRGQTVAAGTTIILRIIATGNPAPVYQWRLNGVNIPGAVYSTLTISNAQASDGGSYSVVVANLGGAVSSESANVRVTSPALPFADNFGNRGTITGTSGAGSGNNAAATAQAGEANHAGKRGGKSVWLRWVAPARGIATFRTRGSNFDTLLAVYTGASISNLTSVAADEDRGGFATSEVSFNTEAGTEYHVVVDGLAGAVGEIVLGWMLDTSASPFPRITMQPRNRTVTNGTPVWFEVDAISVSTAPLRWQWFHGCRLLPGETNRILAIANASPRTVGSYRCFVRNDSTYVAVSSEAFLEIGPDEEVVSQDKLEDVMANVARLAAPNAGNASISPLFNASGVVVVTPGSIDPQIFSNEGSTSSSGEPNHCGVLGGSSKWFAVRVTEMGVVQTDTIGSSIDTVLAAYRGADPLSLVQIGCDNNGAPDGIRSLLSFPAEPGVDYWLVVDGVNAAQGTIQLNWQLGWLSPPIPGLVRTPCLGSTFQLSVSPGDSIPAPSYQWFFNGQPMNGYTNASMTIENVQSTNAGTYSVAIWNFAGAFTNSFGYVGVATPVSITPALVLSNGTRYLQLTGTAANGYVIETTPGLGAPWLRMYTNSSITTAPIQFLDPQPASLGSRYYRIVPWP